VNFVLLFFFQECSQLVKDGKVYAVGTEDMDALTFGADVLVRHLTFSEARLVRFFVVVVLKKSTLRI